MSDCLAYIDAGAVMEKSGTVREKTSKIAVEFTSDSSCLSHFKNDSTVIKEGGEDAYGNSSILRREDGRLVVLGAQRPNDYVIEYGVKRTCGKRPSMEDDHYAEKEFFRAPLSLACENEILPAFLRPEIVPAPVDHMQPGSWGVARDQYLSVHGKSLRCLVDDFHLFMVCDGHGGSAVAKHCTKMFKTHLQKSLLAVLQKSYARLLKACAPPPPPKDVTKTSSGQESVFRENHSGQGNQQNGDWKHIASVNVGNQIHDRGGGCDANQWNAHLHGSMDFGVTTQCMEQAMLSSYEALNEEVRKMDIGIFEGTTAVTVLVGTWHICVANCGDSRAVLFRDGRAVRLTRDHKPDLPDEMKRVQACGAAVLPIKGCARVNGVLAMSRAIGDHQFKAVSAQPEVAVLHRTVGDEFIIIASDGLWDVISDRDACEIARRCLQRSQSRNASNRLATKVAASVLMRAALNNGSMDNISVIVINLQPWPNCTEQTDHTNSRQQKKARVDSDSDRSDTTSEAAALGG